jgi:uncharacterized protein involved in response to NO
MIEIVVPAAPAVALSAWVLTPATPAAGAVLVIAGGLQFTRLARWAGDRTVRDRTGAHLFKGHDVRDDVPQIVIRENNVRHGTVGRA